MFVKVLAGNKDNKAADDRGRKDFGRGQGGGTLEDFLCSVPPSSLMSFISHRLVLELIGPLSEVRQSAFLSSCNPYMAFPLRLTHG